MNDVSIDMDHLRRWIGSEVEAVDQIDRALVDRFALTLDLDPSRYHEGDAAPVGIHWCLSPLLAPTSELGPDGHPARGGFLPPVPLPRRMWAGGSLTYLGRFLVGQTVSRRSRVEDIRLKQGRTGPLIFVTVEHVYNVGSQVLLRERQDIVYRDMPRQDDVAGDPVAAGSAEPSEVSRSYRADAPLLFRYSALTFNSHRIHYDRSYCIDEEHYSGLVVHGPLQATCLLQLGIEQKGWPLSFAFRGQAPLFDGAFAAHGRMTADEAQLWISDPQGRTTMTATAGWS